MFKMFKALAWLFFKAEENEKTAALFCVNFFGAFFSNVRWREKHKKKKLNSCKSALLFIKSLARLSTGVSVHSSGGRVKNLTKVEESFSNGSQASKTVLCGLVSCVYTAQCI